MQQLVDRVAAAQIQFLVGVLLPLTTHLLLVNSSLNPMPGLSTAPGNDFRNTLLLNKNFWMMKDSGLARKPRVWPGPAVAGSMAHVESRGAMKPATLRKKGAEKSRAGVDGCLLSLQN